jgi:hypothetical protein
MHEAATEPHRIGDARRRWQFLRRASLLIVVALVCASGPARAQLPPYPVPLSNTEDARTLPKGAFVLRAMNVWTRLDQVYDAAADSAHHLHPLGNSFSFDSLGVRQFPGLAAAQSALRTLTGDPNISLNLGQTFANVAARYVTTPFSLAYGVSDRLTIGVMVPIVQTKTDVFVELNPRRLNGTTGANVGPNPAQLGNADAQTANNQLILELGAQNSALSSYLDNCSQSGSCSAADLATANAALAKTVSYKAAIQALYGTSPQTSAFAPFGTAQQQVEAQLAALATTISTLLGSSVAFDKPAGANAPAANLQLQQLVTATSGAAYDSLGSPTRIGIGDVEISALYKLVDGFRDSTGVRLRATLRGVLSIGSSLETPSGTVPYEVGIGTGQTSANGGAIVDLGLGRRLMATLAAQYTAFFTSSAVPRLPNSDYDLFPMDVPVAGTWREGNAIQAEAMPRLLLTDYFTIHGAYTFRHQAPSKYTSPDVTEPPLFAASTEQRIGFGFGYSTVARYARSVSVVPLEIFYTHLQTITATGGLTPQYHRDQIEFRIYYRLPRRGR